MREMLFTEIRRLRKKQGGEDTEFLSLQVKVEKFIRHSDRDAK